VHRASRVAMSSRDAFVSPLVRADDAAVLRRLNATWCSSPNARRIPTDLPGYPFLLRKRRLPAAAAILRQLSSFKRDHQFTRQFRPRVPRGFFYYIIKIHVSPRESSEREGEGGRERERERERERWTKNSQRIKIKYNPRGTSRPPARAAK